MSTTPWYASQGRDHPSHSQCLVTDTGSVLRLPRRKPSASLSTAYTPAGERVDNITDWALAQFREHYADEGIPELDIFHYVYAVLHNPAYREKYALNLRREFPRIPFYADFWQWAGWGSRLLELHLGYEQAEPFPLQREDLRRRRPSAAPSCPG